MKRVEKEGGEKPPHTALLARYWALLAAAEADA